MHSSGFLSPSLPKPAVVPGMRNGKKFLWMSRILCACECKTDVQSILWAPKPLGQGINAKGMKGEFASGGYSFLTGFEEELFTQGFSC